MFAPLYESIIGRAQKAGKVEICIHDIREYSTNKHKKCDDYPFGGGAGMVMMPQPVFDAINSIDPEHKSHRIYTSPRGNTLSQAKVQELSKRDNLLILCGHYEGLDERIITLCIDEEISIGDFVLTGGELPAMVMVDAVCRYVDGVIASESLTEESFASGLLEYPQYTRPQEFEGLKVPEVLVSGNHAEVDKWRKQKSIELTAKYRPDLLKK